MITYKQGDVWLAKVYFRNVGEYKNRPIVIVGTEMAIDIDVLSAPVTSTAPRSEYDVVIEYWKEAGLLNPSVARTTKLTAIPNSDFIKKIGYLHEHDLNRILNQCRKLF